MPANAANKTPVAYALVTGASTGIGLELARLFAAHGMPLILSASPRSVAALQETAQQWQTQYGVDVRVFCTDLGQAGAADTLVAWVQAQGLQVDYLVNNAGFGICEQALQDYDATRFAHMLQVNMNTPSLLIRHFLPAMLARGSGRILNVSSIAGYIYPHHQQGAYAASKAYMVSLSESLARELRGTGVTCTHLAPGPVHTAFFASAGIGKARPLAMPADAVAQAGFAAMMEGKARVIPGWGNKLAALGARISPSRRLVGWLAQKALAGRAA